MIDLPPKILAANIFEFCLVAIGWILIWRLRFSAAARAKRTTSPQPLPRWNVDGASFAFAALCVCLGWLAASIAYGQLLHHFPSIKSDEPLTTILSGTLSQLGLLAGVAAGIYYIRQVTTRTPAAEKPPRVTSTKVGLLRAGLVTFLITVSVVIPVQALWKYLLETWHLPTTNQEMVEIFYRNAAPSRVALLATIAVLLAPVAEELVFRGGLFRFLRDRVPHWVALTLPALFFAALHVNYQTYEGLITLAPLAAFGVVFSLAYERTGHIAVVMVAHALFNLHTVVFLLLGLAN
jgi:membrane protease YdiL (CAAX protease family)